MYGYRLAGGLQRACSQRAGRPSCQLRACLRLVIAYVRARRQYIVHQATRQRQRQAPPAYIVVDRVCISRHHMPCATATASIGVLLLCAASSHSTVARARGDRRRHPSGSSPAGNRAAGSARTARSASEPSGWGARSVTDSQKRAPPSPPRRAPAAGPPEGLLLFRATIQFVWCELSISVAAIPAAVCRLMLRFISHSWLLLRGSVGCAYRQAGADPAGEAPTSSDGPTAVAAGSRGGATRGPPGSSRFPRRSRRGTSPWR